MNGIIENETSCFNLEIQSLRRKQKKSIKKNRHLILS